MLGTRQRFRDWLMTQHSLTYSAYGKLTPERKAELQKAYRKGGS